MRQYVRSLLCAILTMLFCAMVACAPSGGVGGVDLLDAKNSAKTTQAVSQDSSGAQTASSINGTDSSTTTGPTAPISYITETTSGLLTLRSEPTLCADVSHISHAPGTPLTLSACNQGVNQQYALTANTLVVYGDRCVKPASSEPNAPLQIATCDPNDTTQGWVQGSDGSIRWLQDRTRCFGSESVVASSNPPIGLYPCDSRNAGQFFVIADASAPLPNLPQATISFTHEPATDSGVTWVDAPANAQVWPSRQSLDWSPFIKQGAVGDCTFLSGLGAVAQHHHDLLRPLIRQTAAHTYQVAFFNAGPSYTSQPNLIVWVEVDDKVAVNPGGGSWYAANPVPDTGNGNALLFTTLFEKGYALYLEKYQLNGFPSNATPQGYAGTVGNSPGVAMSLTGKLTWDTDSTGFNQANAWNYLSMSAQGYPVTSYKANDTADGLPGGHLYYSMIHNGCVVL